MRKTDELTGQLLNDWVARTLGWNLVEIGEYEYWHSGNEAQCSVNRWHPSTAWSQGGPVLQAEYGHIDHQLTTWFGPRWNAHDGIVAEDLLLWTMRAFVASAHGDEVADE